MTVVRSHVNVLLCMVTKRAIKWPEWAADGTHNTYMYVYIYIYMYNLFVFYTVICFFALVLAMTFLFPLPIHRSPWSLRLVRKAIPFVEQAPSSDVAWGCDYRAKEKNVGSR